MNLSTNFLPILALNVSKNTQATRLIDNEFGLFIDLKTPKPSYEEVSPKARDED